MVDGSGTASMIVGPYVMGRIGERYRGALFTRRMPWLREHRGAERNAKGAAINSTC
jgi:hypothetical protein